MSHYFLWARCASIVVLACLAQIGCVSTHVSSKTLGGNRAPVERIALLVQPGTFNSNAWNTASGLGQRNLNALTPHLISTLPAALSKGGVPTRIAPPGGSAGTASVNIGKDETLMLLTPVAATYSSQSGQTLTLRAQAMDVAQGRTFWQAEVRMATLGFGKFDEKVAEDIALQLIERLRDDGLLRPGVSDAKTR